MASPGQQAVAGERAPQEGTGDDGAWRPGLDPHDKARLTQARKDPFAIVEEIPTEDVALSPFSVSCLIFNRMIGSGVFNSSSVIFSNTQSIGISLFLWFIGVCNAISGVILYIELGLTVPRYQLGASKEKRPVVRSGGELPYLNYFFKLPKFLATCVFGVSFIVFGNTAVNSIAFAVATLQAAGAEQTRGAVIGIAVAANTFACSLHSISRKWGIRLNNLLGMTKLTMVILIVIFGFHAVHRDGTTAQSNFSGNTFASPESPKGIYRYAEAAIFALFPFGGFHQANYVLAEIKQPRRYFAIVSGCSVLLICCLTMTVNILYPAVIPKATLFMHNHDQALEYFKHTFGLYATESQTEAITGSFRALSALGNVIVFTFTASRVKQEIAKEGVMPGSLYLASSYSFSFRHGFRRLPQTREGHRLYSSRAPAAALALHWSVTTIIILGTVLGLRAASSHLPAYYVMLASYAYGLDIVWFSVIGVAMLCLRLWPGSKWRHKSKFIPHPVGIAAAAVFTLVNVFPLIAIWIPDPSEPFLVKSGEAIPWFASQTFVFSVLGGGVLYWLGFRLYVYLRESKTGEEFEITRIPIFWWNRSAVAEGGDGRRGYEGELLLLYEIIKVRWRSLRIGENREAMIVAPIELRPRDNDVRPPGAHLEENPARA